ncbi:hypothetical protein RhiLY_00513 [Ceratobasidium sp. AG-Ba]|nr:hypothetical protein RhiLY_00513 [Ceratobasidium sp. AG-Ba]
MFQPLPAVPRLLRYVYTTLVIDKALHTLPRRKTDGAIIIRSQDAPTAKARIFKLNVNVASQPVMLERKTENSYTNGSTGSTAHDTTPGAANSGPFVYILWGAVSQIQGQCPPEAFEGEEAALAMAAARNAKLSAS